MPELDPSQLVLQPSDALGLSPDGSENLTPSRLEQLFEVNAAKLREGGIDGAYIRYYVGSAGSSGSKPGIAALASMSMVTGTAAQATDDPSVFGCSDVGEHPATMRVVAGGLEIGDRIATLCEGADSIKGGAGSTSYSIGLREYSITWARGRVLAFLFVATTTKGNVLGVSLGRGLPLPPAQVIALARTQDARINIALAATGGQQPAKKTSRPVSPLAA
jgi:hypothetical protein